MRRCAIVTAAMAVMGCSILNGGSDSNDVRPVNPGEDCARGAEPGQLRAHLLLLVRMSRDLIEVAPDVANLAEVTRVALNSEGYAVTNIAAVSLVAETGITDPIYLESCAQAAPALLDVTLREAAKSIVTNNLASCEHERAADIGAHLGEVTQGSLSFFEGAPAQLVVVYVDTRSRNHELADCAPAADYFAKLDDGGDLAWVDYVGAHLSPKRVFHVVVATSETGESRAAMTQRCLVDDAVEPSLVDFINPSTHQYFVPFVEQLNAQLGNVATYSELCDTLRPDGVTPLFVALKKAVKP